MILLIIIIILLIIFFSRPYLDMSDKEHIVLWYNDIITGKRKFYIIK